MDFWQVLAIYGVCAGVATFIACLYGLEPMEGDPPGVLIGLFWPIPLLLIPIVLLFALLAALGKAGAAWRKIIHQKT